MPNITRTVGQTLVRMLIETNLIENFAESGFQVLYITCIICFNHYAALTFNTISIKYIMYWKLHLKFKL